MGVSVASKLDRVKLICPIPKEYIPGVEKGFFQLCAKCCVGADTVAGLGIQSYKASFLPNNGSDAMRLELFRCYGKTYLRYDFNPNNIGVAELQSFIKATQCLGYGSYSHVLQAGTIRDLEIAVDYIGQHTTQYLFYRDYVHNSDFYTDGKQDGGSYYLGSRNSDSYIIAYDKAEERHAVGMPYPFKRAMRIEARLKGQGIKVAGIADLPNPFINLTVADIGLMRKRLDVHPAIRENFIKRALKDSAHVALAKFSNKQRPGLKAMMKASGAVWWQTHNVLDGFAGRAHQQLQVEFAKSLGQP